eukprot:TRINITY_DN19329_c0_g1_i1.p1 TRINITY_DN19329_c0_g1~~TRINITY_DN19329_c0_g1_i1.p1  ORF type:complete len:582 (+),score=116.35 TRINITY_DN19329_c0_g1_i1:39-1748(+)
MAPAWRAKNLCLGSAALAAVTAPGGFLFSTPGVRQHKQGVGTRRACSPRATSTTEVSHAESRERGGSLAGQPWQHSGAAVAAAAAVVTALVAAKKKQTKARQSRLAATQRKAAGADGSGLWEPRYSGWTAEELAAERARARTFAEPGPGYSGPRYAGPVSVTKDFVEALIKMQKEGSLLPKKDAYLLVLDMIDILRSETTMGQVSIPAGKHLTVVGDLHGQYWDFMNILSLAGMPSADSPFIFNGDFVDRGSWSIEVILVIFAMKLKDPKSVSLNRGNHEMLETNILYGFCGECGVKYDMDLFNLFSEAFRNLPLCQLVEKRALVLHGGLPGPDPRIWMPGQTHDPTDAIPMSSLATLEDIAATDRYLEITPEAYAESLGPKTTDKEVNDKRHLIDILWGDPRGGVGYGPSYRKAKGVYMFGPDVSKAFCEKNNLQCVVRSHEVKAAGWRWDHPHILSVFSAPNYLDTGNNQGAFLKVTKSADGNISFEPVSYSAVPHPDVPPMKWQEHITENYGHLTRLMKKKVGALGFDEFGDSDFEGLMNFDEWEPDEAEAFQDAFKLDEFGREKK